LTESALWNNFVDVRLDFASADYVSPYTVFNIKGNRYRLISVIDFATHSILIKHVLTHAIYDRGNWK
jgi:mRNA interferase HigB